MTSGHMRDFWDARAREDAYFFVDDRRAYGKKDLERFWTEGERDLDRIFELLELELTGDEVVLDIGCGVGRLTRVLAGRAKEVYALDVSREMLARARHHHASLDNVRWLEGDGTTLAPIPDATIDACVSHVVFQHIPDPAVTLGYVGEMGRVLRPGGWAAFQVSNDPSVHRPRERDRRLRRLITSAIGRRPRGVSDPAWLGAAIELSDLRAEASESGLVLERVVGEGTQFCMVRARRDGAAPSG
jgi:SAM-dependent methyltransferase